MVAPITSLKHYVQHSQANVLGGTIVVQDVVDAVAAPASATTSEVKQGSLVKAIYFERWMAADVSAGVFVQFVLTVEKLPSSVTEMTFTQSNNLSSYTNKKNILYTTQGILNASINGSQAVPVIRQYILIPKGKQRMGLGDRIVVNIAVLQTMAVCGIETYKEYT